MATVERLDNSRVKFQIEVSAQDFDQALADTFLKTRKKYNVPGFRKGKAPRAMIENLYGEGVFYEDAFDQLYADAYDKAIKDNEIDPVDSPDIAIDQIGKGMPLLFTAQVDVRPEVTLGDYKGIEVVKRTYTVEDAEVDALIETEREKIARFVDQDRPIENGDQVVLDYSGSIDGELFDGGTAEGQTLTIGSNMFIPGFEGQLIGMEKGEERDICVTFPEEYHAEDLAGKEAVFKVRIHQITVKELPELDDDFAQDVSEFDTFEAFRADKRATLEKRNEMRAKADMENEAVKKAVDNASMCCPESMIAREMDHMLRELNYKLSMSGLTLEQYMQFSQKTYKDIREDYRAAATERIRMQCVIEAISKELELEATEEDIENAIKEYCEENNQDLEEFKKNLKEESKEFFKDRIRADQTVKYLMEHARYVDAPVEQDEIVEAPASDHADAVEKDACTAPAEAAGEKE